MRATRVIGQIDPPKKKAPAKANFRSFMKTQKNDLNSMVLQDSEPMLLETGPKNISMTLKPSKGLQHEMVLGSQASVDLPMTPVEAQKEEEGPTTVMEAQGE